jgi:hypothetical protein
MLNNFIYAKIKDSFLKELEAGNVSDEAIVFIEDTKEIWNHGTYFGPEKLINITYLELKSLRDDSQLTPGSFYRITDYVTTTTQLETKSANHPFDVIVLALSENTLSEDAKAILHEGDTYFTDSDLSVWELKYCLDNDKTRFEWADETNGKGVIYRMIDEKRNDCPYDFKNILFYNTVLTGDTTGDKYYYTFTYVVGGIPVDGTTEKQVKKCYGNVMGEYYNMSGVLRLNNNVFRNYEFVLGCNSNKFGNNCYSNTFGFACNSNNFGEGCNSNIFRDSCQYNTFGNQCSSNTFGLFCKYNIFGDKCQSNTFGGFCSSNTFGDECVFNTLKSSCQYNTFGGDCNFNILGDECQSNIFGDNLQNRSLNSDKTSITLNEEYYDDGSDQLVPTKHPDLSTQPSILPYKFMGQYVYEQLIPVNKGDRIVNNEFVVEIPMIISAEMFGVNSFKSINIFAAKSNALLLDTLSEMDGYINVKYTDGSVLLPSDGYYYGSTSTSPSNNSLRDFGIMEDGLMYIYDNDVLSLSKNGEIGKDSIPSQYKNSSKIIIDNNVTSILSYTFTDCSGLTSVVIPNSVTSIGDWAFSYCSSLTSVEIGNSVTSIGDYAFGSCSSLTSITCRAINPPNINSYTFNTVSKSIPLYVPAESVEAYKSANYWKEFTNIQAINE